METEFTIQAPHEEAAALIRSKPAITREVFDGLLPELRARAFTITGVEGAGVLQRTRDAIAGLAEGERWDDAKKQIIAELDPYLGDGSANRAELLLRTHAFQAFQAANWRVAQEDQDTTHLQYLTMEDGAVRDSHAALDGVILPKDDPFWEKHYPPWEWNCRCLARPINPDFVAEEQAKDELRNPEDRNVITGPVLDQLRNGTLIRGTRRFDVTPPSDSQLSNSETAFQWHPDNLRLPLDTLQARYDAPVWEQFQTWAKGQPLDAGTSIWDWLGQKPGQYKPATSPPIASTPSGPARRRAAVRKNVGPPVQNEDGPDWRARELTDAEIAKRRAAIEKQFQMKPVPSVAEELKSIKAGEISGSQPAAVQREMARLEVAQQNEIRDLLAARAIHSSESPAGNSNEALAQWTTTRRNQIDSKYRKLRQEAQKQT